MAGTHSSLFGRLNRSVTPLLEIARTGLCVQVVRHLMMLGGLLALVASAILLPAPAARAATGDWTTYLFSSGRTGYNPNETVINPTTAPHLTKHLGIRPGGKIFSQPIVANGLVYVGTYNGYEYAINPASPSKPVWHTFVGTTQDLCSSQHIGVVSTATIYPIGGTSTLFVGGGNTQLYALNAMTGAVMWHTAVGGQMNWTSPLVASVVLPGGTTPTTVVYMGTASFCDSPLVQGKLVQLNAATGQILRSFNVVPNGCVGGSIWGSPTFDMAAGTVYVATGNMPPKSTCSEPDAEAVIELNASSLALIGAWQVPAAQRATDSDFGSTPTLFTASIGGTTTSMVGVQNKNGIFYAFARGAISSGPVWQTKISVGGPSPQKGTGNTSPAAFDGSQLYVAGGTTTIQGVKCAGVLDALNPSSGAVVWQTCLAGPVLGAVTAVPGVVTVGNGTAITVVAASTGNRLFTFTDTNTGSKFYGPASIANGMLYEGNMDGMLYGFTYP